jgi:thioester reductase-like protein
MTVVDGAGSRADVVRRALVELKAAKAELARVRVRDTEPIAVVGIGCRMPGVPADAGPEGFWELLRHGRSGVVDIPGSREAGGYARHAGLLEGIREFDVGLFGVPPREAAGMDPQQRLVLEVAWAALEHAGIAPDGLRGSRTGVFVGAGGSDYARLGASYGDPALIDAYAATGGSMNFVANRLSYTLGLAGPSLAVDTACSSSLVAVHLAVRALREGECDLALAGGVNALLAADAWEALCQARMVSERGACRTFDAGADGYVRGEGCGIVVLKRLSDTADDEEVLAVVRGSAVNQDGRSSGITVPNAAAQRAVVRAALEAARVRPAEVGYVEAHGTGTPLGDPIELRALAGVLSEDRPAERPLLVGSVKTNIGHLEAAAGIAGFIKAVLAVRHGLVPPHLNLTVPSPHIPWDELPVRIPVQPAAWTGPDRIAGVSSFGFGGTNAHVVLADAPDRPAPPGAAADVPVLVKVSAATPEALRASADALAAYADKHRDLPPAALAWTAGVGRADLKERAAVVAQTTDELIDGLRAVADSPYAAAPRDLAGTAAAVLPEPAAGLPASARRRLLGDLAVAWTRGAEVDWKRVNPRTTRLGGLPGYPFERREHWLPEPAEWAGRPLRPRFVLPATGGAVAETVLSLRRLPFLEEHRVFGRIVVPGVVFVELVLQAGERLLGGAPVLEEVVISRPMTFADDAERAVQVVVDPVRDGTARARVFGTGPQGEWHLQMEARLAPARSDGDPAVFEPAGDGLELDADGFYQRAWHPSFVLGPSFRLVRTARTRPGAAEAVLSGPDPASLGSRAGVRPDLLLLDACVQLVPVAAGAATGPETPVLLGTGYRRVVVHEPVTASSFRCRVHARTEPDGSLVGDLTLTDGAGRPVAEMHGVSFRAVSPVMLDRLLAAPATMPDRPEPDRAALRSPDRATRRAAALAHLTVLVATVLGADPVDVDPEAPLVEHLDSLMLTELRAAIDRDLGLLLPLERMLDDGSIAAVAGRAAAELAPARTGGPRVLHVGMAAMGIEELAGHAALDPEITPAAGPEPPGTAPDAVLLTGATGFVGAFVLAELLARGTGPVRCLVRAEDEAHAMRRILGNLEGYRVDLGEGGASRIVPVLGDLTKECFGLSPQTFAALHAETGSIVHCGAMVKWTYPFRSLAAANVAGTREVLRLAAAGAARPVHFASSVGVFSSRDYTAPTVAETEPLTSAGSLVVGYAQTKWAAEAMVRAAGERGVPFTVHRINTGGHSRTGAFNRLDHLSLMIKGCVEAGIAPDDAAMPVQPAPVDYVAAALAEAARRPGLHGSTFHLVNGTSLSWPGLFDLVEDFGYPLERLPFEDWRSRITSRRSGTMALLGLVPFLNDAVDHVRLPLSESALTTAALEPLGLACPPLGATLVRTYLETFVRDGFIDPPARRNVP